MNEKTPDPEGGKFERGPDGKLTGRVEERATAAFRSKIPNTATRAERDGLIHRAIIDDGYVYLLVAFLGLKFRKRVGRIAGDILDFHAVLFLEGWDDVLAHRLLERAAIRGYVQCLGLGEGLICRPACERGSRRNGEKNRAHGGKLPVCPDTDGPKQLE